MLRAQGGQPGLRSLSVEKQNLSQCTEYRESNAEGGKCCRYMVSDGILSASSVCEQKNEVASETFRGIIVALQGWLVLKELSESWY